MAGPMKGQHLDYGIGLPQLGTLPQLKSRKKNGAPRFLQFGKQDFYLEGAYYVRFWHRLQVAGHCPGLQREQWVLGLLLLVPFGWVL